MDDNLLKIIDIITNIISAIATPVAIIVAIKEFKRSFSIQINIVNNAYLEINVINECSHVLLINKLLINNAVFEIKPLKLEPATIETLHISLEALKSFNIKNNKFNLKLLSSKRQKAKGKIRKNEIKF